MSDDPYEAERLREEALASVEQLNEQLAERQRRIDAEGAVSWTPSQPDPQPPRRQREPPPPKPKPDPAPPVPNEILRTRHDSSGRIIEVEKYSGSAAAAKNSWEHWIRQHVESRLKTVYDTVGEVMGQMAKEERAAIDARMVEESGRLAEAVRVLGQAVETLNGRMKSLEARLVETEERLPPVRPKLVSGGSDAA